MATRDHVEDNTYIFAEGKQVVIRRTFIDLLGVDGNVLQRRLVNREIIGDISEQEALDLAKRLGWV